MDMDLVFYYVDKFGFPFPFGYKAHRFLPCKKIVTEFFTFRENEDFLWVSACFHR